MRCEMEYASCGSDEASLDMRFILLRDNYYLPSLSLPPPSLSLSLSLSLKIDVSVLSSIGGTAIEFLPKG